MVQNGSIWFKMDLFGSKWINLVQNGSERCWTFLSHVTNYLVTLFTDQSPYAINKAINASYSISKRNQTKLNYKANQK